MRTSRGHVGSLLLKKVSLLLKASLLLQPLGSSPALGIQSPFGFATQAKPPTTASVPSCLRNTYPPSISSELRTFRATAQSMSEPLTSQDHLCPLAPWPKALALAAL